MGTRISGITMTNSKINNNDLIDSSIMDCDLNESTINNNKLKDVDIDNIKMKESSMDNNTFYSNEEINKIENEIDYIRKRSENEISTSDIKSINKKLDDVLLQVKLKKINWMKELITFANTTLSNIYSAVFLNIINQIKPQI